MSELKRERNACLSCSACFKPLEDGLSATGGGYETRIIDGRNVICCRPAPAWGRKRTMDRYDFYCLATPNGKKIAKGADYTGLTPKWCPRLEVQHD